MHTQKISVTGMTCGGCVRTLSRTLRGIDGVEEANVSLASASATVQFDDQRISLHELEQAVARAGYSVSSNSAEASSADRRGCCSGALKEAASARVAFSEQAGVCSKSTSRTERS